MRDEHQAAIGAPIARLREQQGWSQRALAKWVGIDQSAVSRIEAGRRRLSADELQRFADALHVSADELLRGLPAAPTLDAGADAASAPCSATKFHSYSSADASRRTAARDDAGLPLEMRPAAARRVPTESRRRAAGVRRDASRCRACVGLRRRTIGASPDRPRPRTATSGALDADQAEPSALHTPRASKRQAHRRRPVSVGLPDEAAGVARDWFELRRLAASGRAGAAVEHRPLGRGQAGARLARGLVATRGSLRGDVLYDRVARFWRSELHVDPDDGPLPDLVPLLEDGYGVQVIVARVGGAGDRCPSPPAHPSPPATSRSSSSTPPGRSCCSASRSRTPSPTSVLGHGDVVDRRIEWNRNNPPEAAANDFAEELLRAGARRAALVRAPRSTPRPGATTICSPSATPSASAPGRRSTVRAPPAGCTASSSPACAPTCERHEWQLLPRQAFLGGLRDTLTSPDAGRESCRRASTERRRCCACRPRCAPGRSPPCTAAA